MSRARPPRAARWSPQPAPGCMRSVLGPEATDPPRAGRSGHHTRRHRRRRRRRRAGAQAAARAPGDDGPRPARSTCAMVPRRAAVVRVDIRWVPRARAPRAMPGSMRTHCVWGARVDTPRMVRWDVGRRARGVGDADGHGEYHAGTKRARAGLRARPEPLHQHRPGGCSRAPARVSGGIQEVVDAP